MPNPLSRISIVVGASVVAFAYFAVASSLSLGYREFVKRQADRRTEHAFATHGLSQIGPAAEMYRLFKDCRHAVHGEGLVGTSTWFSAAYFGDRYVLEMQVPVAFTPSMRGRVIGEPSFFLKEVTNVTISATGYAKDSYSPIFSFGLQEWNKIYASTGDFGSIGLKLNPTAVSNFQAYAKQARP